MSKIVIGLLLLLLALTGAEAQQILFRNYSVKDGLCANTVWSIAQDDKGYMWFGTKNGLNRFNGYEFTTYQFDPGDKYSIGNNFVHTICRFNDKTFWVGTEDGIFSLDLETEQFTLLPIAKDDLIFDIFRDSRGLMWIASGRNGVYQYDPVKNKIVHFRVDARDSNSISLNSVRTIAEDNKGRIWIGTFGEGIDVFDPATSLINHIKLEARPGHPNSNRIMRLYKDANGNMWAGSLGGLHVWMREADSITSYYQGPGSINENIIRAIYQATPDQLYIGTEKGLNILDLKTQTFSSYTHKNNDPRSISDNAIYSIYPDREGGIWLGTFFGGLNYFPRKGTGFESFYATGEKNSLSGNAVSCFLEDKPGFFYVGTENAGLNYFDSRNKSFNSYPFSVKQQPLSYHNIHSLLKDQKGNLWVGTFSAGLNVADKNTGKVKQYLYDGNDSTSLSNNNIYSLYQDKSGSIWVGTTKGLNIYDVSKDAFIRVNDAGLQQNIIYGIYEDDMSMWFLTYDRGLVSLNKSTRKWNRYIADGKTGSISSNRVIAVLDDQEGNLWLGTDGGGLNRFNKKSKVFTAFGASRGISSVVYGILKDGHGDLWLSTNVGIINFQPHTGKSIVYNNVDDLQSDQFNYNAAIKASDGKMYFGGITGFNSFYPDSLIEYNQTGNIALTGFQLFNKSVQINNAEGPLKKTIAYAERIDLSHDQSVISFEYAAMSYLAPAKISYAYMMNGFDKTWNYVGAQRKATYTNLPPGSYTFQVKSTDIYGNWRNKTTGIKVIVLPPFYWTTVAYIIYLLILAGIIYTTRKMIIARAHKRNEINLARLQSQRDKEFYNQKIDFFTTMAHEIRTPLSLIIAPLEKLIATEDWKPETRQQLTTMDENADRLLNLVNQLLDFRRIESDIYTIKCEEVEIISFIHSLYSRFSPISYQKGLRFFMRTSTDRLRVSADPEALTKIITNLLINAFKYARNEVTISVNEVLKDENDLLLFSISVIDDGPGIPADQIDNIFKPFFVVNDGAATGGTGIGLALAKSLAEKHQGRLRLEQGGETRTVFTVLIPFNMPAINEAAMDAEPGMDAAVSPATDTVSATSHRTTILVVEDDYALSEFITRGLQDEDYLVLGATNGVEALKLLEEKEVDLILSDVMMPEMDGIELCRQVKGNISYSHIPLILLTAKSNSETEIAGLESGADAYIIKPFKWKHVTVVVRNLIESGLRLKAKFTQHPLSDVGTLSTNTQDKKFIENITSVIESRITDPQLSVEELSREMAMSRSGLHKKLKAMSGHVPNEFIRLIRLKNAAKLLLGGELNVSEVCYRVGFSSHSYFSKCFASQFNETPSEFAQRHQPVLSSQEQGNEAAKQE